MTNEQLSHHSENLIDLFKDRAHAIIPSDNMGIDEQVSATLELVNNLLGTYA